MSYIGTTKIGKMYLGNTEIAKAYLGTDLVFQRGAQPQPTTIPYIRGGSNGSYINTGITPDSTTRVIVFARNWNPGGGIIFGTRNGANQQNFFMAANAGTPTAMTIGYYNSSTTMSGDIVSLFSGYHKYELNGNSFYVDDVLIGSASSSSISCTYPLHIFGLNSGGTHANNNRDIDICACKIYKGGSLVRDFSAVNSPSIGLFDAVSQTLFTNSGNGNFTYGEFNQNAFKQLQYISCTGQQYIDTQVTAGYNNGFIMLCSPTGSELGWHIPVGARNTTQQRCEFFFGNTTTAYKDLSAGYVTATYAIYSSGNMVDTQIALVKSNNKFSAYKNNTALGSTYTGSASTSYNNGLYYFLGALNSSGVAGSHFIGKIYFAGFGSLKNFVPAKVNNVAGLYDTYNGVFYPSATSTPFIAGPTI